MAEFDDNPFADPANINPFADPSVQAATSAPKTEDDYNPFADEGKQKDPEPIKLPPPPTKSEVKAKEKKEKQKSKSKPAPKKPAPSEPAIMEPEEPPAYTSAPSSFRDPADNELKKREEEIARREEALSDRERNIERLGSSEKPNNFPPFPKFCPAPFKPCFYINVKVEVPPSEHWKVYCLLALMIYVWILLVINLIVSIAGAATISPTNQGVYLTTMGVSVVYLILFAPGTFFCWFLPVYYAYKKDSSLAFMWFFFVMAFQILSFILSAIGIPNLGACGFFNGATLFNGDNKEGSVAAGAMYMIVGFLWFFPIIPAVFILVMIHRYYRSSGGSINQAITEGVSGAAKNEAVKGAVKSTVKAGVKTALTSDNN